MILLETIYVADNNWAIQIIMYRRRLYFATFTHIFVLKEIFFPKIEFYFIQRKLPEAKYVSFLSTTICDFHFPSILHHGNACRPKTSHNRASPKFLSRGARYAKFASATRELGNLLFHFVNVSDITSGMRCKWPRDVAEVQIPAGWVFT